MRQRDHFRWIWGFWGAMLPAALTAWLLANHLGTTYAVGLANTEESTNITALSTHDALAVDPTVIDAGHLRRGDEVQVEVRIQNIWERPLDIGLALEDLPGWSAELEHPVLAAGESTTLYLTGFAQVPGAFAGTVHITALGEFLALQVAVIGEVVPDEVVPDERVPDELVPDEIPIDEEDVE